MMNIGGGMGGFLAAFNRSIAGDLALSWIRSLPIDHDHQEEIVRIFNDFWVKGIVFAKEPQGKGITIKEFKELDPQQIEGAIMAREDLSENEKYKRIEYYKKFRKWVDAPWKKEGYGQEANT